jgi:hypothetical protein
VTATRRPTTAATAQHGRREEDGAVLIFAVVLIVAIGSILVLLTTNSDFIRNDSQRTQTRVMTQPFVLDTVTAARIAFDAELATPADFYTLDADDLRSLAPSSDVADEFVTPLADLPPEFRSVGGVWRNVDSEQLERVDHPNAVLDGAAYHQPASPTAEQCAKAGLATAPCQTQLHGFWQLYRVQLPDVTSDDSNGATVHFYRAWLQPVDDSLVPTGQPFQPQMLRVELRQASFADYQLISNGPIRFLSGSAINGKVHSNGNEVLDTYAEPTATASGTAVRLDGTVTCSDAGSITTAKGSISGVPTSGSCLRQEATGQQLSFLGAYDELDRLENDALVAGAPARVYAAWDSPTLSQRATAWRVTLKGDRIEVAPPPGMPAAPPVHDVIVGETDTGILFQDDVVILGGSLYGRATIAARRGSRGVANVYVAGSINEDNTNAGATFGIVAQGDIIVDQPIGNPCAVDEIRAAMVAVTGSLTLAPQLTTSSPHPRTSLPMCSGAIEIIGSIAGHRPPTLQTSWSGAIDAGNAGSAWWTGYLTRDYRWDDRLKSAPPPYLPKSENWQVMHARVANVDCYAGERIADADCR